MNGKVRIVCLLQLVFLGIISSGSFATEQEHDVLAGRYSYGDETDEGLRDRVNSGSISIIKTDSAYAVDISVSSTGGGRGSAGCQFKGIGKISGNVLLVSNSITFKNKRIPVTFKIYLNNSPELAGYAKKSKQPEFSRLKPGQIAVIDDGELERQIPNVQLHDWQEIALPDGDSMCLMDSLSFDGVYTKENPGKQKKAQRTETPKVSPSFDCAKASNAVERAICADPILADLDVQMARQYKLALNAAANKNTLKKEQRQWLQQMHSQCSGADSLCIQQHYRNRLSQLNAVSKRI